jgi:hypothetical protein
MAAAACFSTVGISHEREPVDAQGVGDRGCVAGRRSHVPLRARSRSAVTGLFVGHPADGEYFGGEEEGLGGRADLERTVVPEDGGRPSASCPPAAS